MKWINKIAYHRNIRNETPNRELAKELYDTENKDGIKEISEYLFDKNKSIASDCLAVMYEIGYNKPQLISGYLEIFLKLLESKNNRMVWGAMIAITTISKIKAKEIFQQITLILNAIDSGTVITEVWGIKTLASLSSIDGAMKKKLMPILADYLQKARPVDFTTRLEDILQTVSTDNDAALIGKIVKEKLSELSEAQKKKLKTLINKFNKNTKSPLNIIKAD